jgi:hypothetical protein
MEGRKKAPEAEQFLRCSILIKGRLCLRMRVFVPKFQRALFILTTRGRDQVRIEGLAVILGLRSSMMHSSEQA